MPNYYLKASSEQNYKAKSKRIPALVPNYYLKVLSRVFQAWKISALAPKSTHGSFQWNIWDPGIAKLLIGKRQTLEFLDNNGFTAGSYPYCNHKQRNKLIHTTNGNRGLRGRGMVCAYWNKGPSFLTRKQLDIETIISTHKPHILGLGEANMRHDHDIAEVQQTGYSLHLDSSINNPRLGVARVAVYTSNVLRVKRREDLEDDTVAAVWLECGLPNQKGLLICSGYRQWGLLGQQDNSSRTVEEQLARWLVFLEKWETALKEDKEVIVMMDANLDFLTWTGDDGSLPN